MATGSQSLNDDVNPCLLRLEVATIYALVFSSSSTHCVFVTDDFAMQEALATLKDELKTIVKLATNFCADEIGRAHV